MTNSKQDRSLPTQDGRRVMSAVVAPPVSGDSNQPITVLRLPEVMERVGLCRASIYLHMGQGHFPRSISIGPRAVGWLEHEITAWLIARAAARFSPAEIKA